MKNEIKEMIKSVINENAVSFKETTSKVLYGKVATKLQEQYKKTAKKLFETAKPLSRQEKRDLEDERKEIEEYEKSGGKMGKYEPSKNNEFGDKPGHKKQSRKK